MGWLAEGMAQMVASQKNVPFFLILLKKLIN
jgi:hypothetical protein